LWFLLLLISLASDYTMYCWYLQFHRQVFWCCRQEWRSEKLRRAYEIANILQAIIDSLLSEADPFELAKLDLASVSWSMTIALSCHLADSWWRLRRRLW
jgi:hypothetical protein